MKYRLGLDVGANSLGWSILETDAKGAPVRLKAAGVRIFGDGRDEKSLASLAASRREARSARRRRDRYKQRRTFLLHELTKAGLFPADLPARRKLQGLEPLQLRADALAKELPPHHIGRVLFHINQRRGFKSMRKEAQKNEKESGIVKQSVAELREQMGAQNTRGEVTFGAFLWRRRKERKPTRARPRKDGKGYDFYPDRALLQDEFDTVCKAQQKHHPHILTDAVVDRLRYVIFYQRPLKPQDVGQCSYFPKEKRAYRAMPSVQRYRIYQEANNLEWDSARGTVCKLREAREMRDAVVRLLEKSGAKNGKVAFNKIRTLLKKAGAADGDCRFNLETAKRKDLHGNLTANLMRDEKRVGARWDEWRAHKQDDFIAVIMDNGIQDEDARRLLMKDYGIGADNAEECINAPLPQGTADVSLKAARLLADKMRAEYCRQSDAVQAAAKENADFVNPYSRASDKKADGYLPYYGKVFTLEGKHIVPGKQDLKHQFQDKEFWGAVTNPSVHIALNQIGRLVNYLMYTRGVPDSIAIELGRDLPAGPDKRREMESQQKENQERNEALDKELRDLGQQCNRANRLQLRLWQELPDRRCIFSGKKIAPSMLFTPAVEVEHLLPFADYLDDSYANKVLCLREANRAKGKHAPFESFGASPPGYAWNEIHERAQKLPGAKRWRFRENAKEIWLGEHGDDFLARHLNDTRYIGRLAKDYLANMCPFNNIDVMSGRLTALLRGHWGLNGVLPANSDGAKKKNRDDHRHHAVDAVVIGATTRSILQKVSKAARRGEDISRLNIPEPWKGFRDEAEDVVGKIVVSHRTGRKHHWRGPDGKLHNDTAYGIIERDDKTRMAKVVHRKPVDALTTRKSLQAIRDRKLREMFLSAFDKGGKDAVAELAKQTGVRRLRITEKMKVITVKDAHGKPYKAHKGDSNWAVEIYAFPKGHAKEGKWHGAVIPRFDAFQEGFRMGMTFRPHPAASLVMRLRINDCIKAEVNGEGKLLRLQKISEGVLTFAEIHEANVDRRNRDKENAFSYITKSADKLREMKARKAHISPTGKVMLERPHYDVPFRWRY